MANFIKEEMDAAMSVTDDGSYRGVKRKSEDTNVCPDDAKDPATEAKRGFDHKDSGSDWSYFDQVILAPMVRIGTLPTRILAASVGAIDVGSLIDALQQPYIPSCVCISVRRYDVLLRRDHRPQNLSVQTRRERGVGHDRLHRS